jgi:uncharacterized membrane protein
MASEVPPPFPPPPGSPPEPPPLRASRDETIMLVLCYVGLLALVPYLAARDSPIVRWHARQGLALGLLGICCAGLALVPYLGFIGQLGLAGVLVLSVVGIIKALDRAEWRMPVAADIADRFEL